MSKTVRRQPQTNAAWSHHGGEVKPDFEAGKPLELPVGACLPLSLNEMMANFVRAEIDRRAEDPHGSFEDEDDFEEEDPDVLDFSPYTLAEVDSPLDPTFDPFRQEEPPQEAAPEAPQDDDSDERSDEAG